MSRFGKAAPLFIQFFWCKDPLVFSLFAWSDQKLQSRETLEVICCQTCWISIYVTHFSIPRFDTL